MNSNSFQIMTSNSFQLLKKLCTEDDNSSYRNDCKMSVVSFALAVIFIIRLFSTSVFRIPNILHEKIVLICSGHGRGGGDRNLFVRKGGASQKKIGKHCSTLHCYRIRVGLEIP